MKSNYSTFSKNFKNLDIFGLCKSYFLSCQSTTIQFVVLTSNDSQGNYFQIDIHIRDIHSLR